MNRLTKKEEQIMLIIWKLDRAMVKDIIGELPAPAPHVNTVSS
ncbi:MAG: BlaI/MecI/CopY family transcriptional regulator, partial [Bacteroidota bacterium]